MLKPSNVSRVSFWKEEQTEDRMRRWRSKVVDLMSKCTHRTEHRSVTKSHHHGSVAPNIQICIRFIRKWVWLLRIKMIIYIKSIIETFFYDVLSSSCRFQWTLVLIIDSLAKTGHYFPFSADMTANIWLKPPYNKSTRQNLCPSQHQPCYSISLVLRFETWLCSHKTY